MSDTNTADEFDAAFAEATGSPASEPDATPASQAAEVNLPEPGAEPQPLIEPAPTIEDIWANASPEMRAAFEAAQQEARTYKHRVQSDEGRVARYQRERDEARNQLKTVASVAEKADPETIMGSEEWQKAKADYGDDLKPVFGLVETLAERNKQWEQRFAQLDERDAEAFEERQAANLTERCEDWRELLGDPGFPVWLEAQPGHVQQAIELNMERLVDISQVADVAERYRSFRNPQPQPTPPPTQPDHKRAAQLEASRTANVKTPVAADTVDDFDGFFKVAAAQIERQRVAGR